MMDRETEAVFLDAVEAHFKALPEVKLMDVRLLSVREDRSLVVIELYSPNMAVEIRYRFNPSEGVDALLASLRTAVEQLSGGRGA